MLLKNKNSAEGCSTVVSMSSDAQRIFYFIKNFLLDQSTTEFFNLNEVD